MTKEYETCCEVQREYRELVQHQDTPLYNHLFALDENIFNPSFLKAIQDNTPEALQQILHEEHPGIYSFVRYQRKQGGFIL